jgi:hypothetical protein
MNHFFAWVYAFFPLFTHRFAEKERIKIYVARIYVEQFHAHTW